MKRKILIGLFAVVAVSALTFWLCACEISSEINDRPQIDGSIVDFPDFIDSEHKWDEGVVTTQPTCITPGVITYTCLDCGAIKKEPLDANGNHVWENYTYDDEYHWRACRLCGEFEKHEHDFGGATKDSNVDDILECECGIHKTVGEFYSYKVSFDLGDGVSIRIYDTQNYDDDGTISNVAYSRDSETGELLNNGEGQVNFEVVVALGYKLIGVTASPTGNFKNLKGSDETGRDNTFRLTKITGEVTVTVQTEIEILDLPVMVINTENSAPVLDKVNYVTCSVSVLGAETEYCFAEAAAGIRGRGNSTWYFDKKPYKLKFGSKVDLFGNGKAKTWTLIANYTDPSLMRNYLAFALGRQFTDIGLTTTTTQCVELYLNGSYEGVYLVCEQIETGSTRVDIQDDFTEAATPEDMGYLLEMDDRAPDEGIEDLDYITVNGKWYAIKSPDYEDLVGQSDIDFNDYVSFIKEYMNSVWDALYSRNYSLVTNCIDVNSFADSYIINELFHTYDIGGLSFFLYKKENGKLYSGPIWDFDVSSGNYSSSDPQSLWAQEKNIWYKTLLEYDEFKLLVKQKLQGYSQLIRDVIASAIEEMSAVKNSIDRNFERWGVLGENIWPNPPEMIAITTWEGQVDYVKEWLLNSLDYMLQVYCS